MKKKVISMVLCATMAMSMAGTMTTAVSAEETKTLSCFVNFSWYPVDSFTGKIPDAIREVTGVDLDVTIATDAKQLGVMIASGELPDIVFTDTELNELSDANVCYSLDELEEMTGITFTGAENYEERNAIAGTLSEDGKSYTLLNAYNTAEEWENLKMGAVGQPVILFRKDLLEAAGLEEPQSLDEFYECLKQLKEVYPDMTPLGLGGYWKFQPISVAFGIAQQNYDGTNYLYDTSTPSYRDFLTYCNKLYREGLVSPEDYANENEETGHQMAYNDGCVFYTWYLANTALQQLQSNAVSETAQWDFLNPIGEAFAGNSKGWAGAFISRNCSDTEAAAKIVSYLNTPEGCALSRWGVEGEDYTLDENGIPQFSEAMLAARDDSEVWNKEINPLFCFGSSMIAEIYMNYSGMDEEVLAKVNQYAEGYKNYAEVGIALPSTISDEGVIRTKLEELKKNYEAKVIFTDTDEAFEAAYAEYTDALNKTGVDKLNAYMTERIAEVKETYGIGK